jgi:hypothetical protein
MAQSGDAANRWPRMMTSSQHDYEVRPRKDHRGVDQLARSMHALQRMAQCD